MQENTAIDFGQVDPAAESSYLAPGMYRLKVDAENTRIFTPENKTPYLSVRFVDQNGSGINEKFYLTSKAMPRLQYLHEAWFGKRSDKKFTSFVQVGEYFQAAMTAKIVTRPMIVAGKITTDGKFFAGLPYSGFVIVDESLFEEGPFEKGSEQYNKVVKVEKPNPAVAHTDASILPEASGSYQPAATATGGTPWD